MRKMKKILSWMLVFVMVFSCVPSTVKASDETEGNTTSVTAAHMATRPADGITKDQPFPLGTAGSTQFRIPGMVALNDGSIVAICDARWNTSADAGGLDTIVSRSSDKGKTWRYTFANYMGDNGNSYNVHSASFIDPAIATDGETLWMIADLFPGGYSTAGVLYRPTAGDIGFNEDGNLRLSNDDRTSYGYYLSKIEDGTTAAYYEIKDTAGNVVEGYVIDAYFNIRGITEDTADVNTNLFIEDSPFEVYPTDYLYQTSSTDGGATWSVPKLIDAKFATEGSLLIGPGTGKVFSFENEAGETVKRIMFTAYDFTTSDGHSCTIYSDDGGETWTRGTAVTDQTSEATVTVADGRLYMFTRHGGYYVSEDWGETWSAKQTPGASWCWDTMINSITYSKKIDGKTAIILSAPGQYRRQNGKLYVALVEEDGSLSWKYEYKVNENGALYAYSTLTELPDGSISLLYEDTWAPCGMTYVNIPISDIVGIWLEDSTGATVTDVELEAGESVVLNLLGTPENTPQIVSDNEAVTGTWDAVNSTVTIAANANVTAVETAVVTITDGSGSSFEINVTVTATDVTEYKIVELNVGETVEFIDDSGDYTNTDVSGVSSVAEVTFGGGINTITETRAQLATAAGNFSGDMVNISDCLYTFDNVSIAEGSTTTFTCTPTATAGSTTVYLNQENATTIPNATSAAADGVEMSLVDGTFTIRVANAGKYLYFHYNDSSKLYFNRNSSAAAGACYFELYTASESAPEDSPIPGYKKVTSLDEITEDGQYLIAHEGIIDSESIGYYILHPYSGGSDYHHVAKATGEVPGSSYTEITIKGVAEGTSSIKIGGITYAIRVKEKKENVTLGMYEKFFIETANAPQIGTSGIVNAVANEETDPPYEVTGELKAGKYLIVRSGYVLSNAIVQESPSGLTPVKVDFEDNLADYLWTVAEAEGGYTIQDAEGQYINISGTSVTLTSTAQTMTVTDKGDNLFAIGVNNVNLNNYGGTNSKVAAYSGVDNNSKWYFYEPVAGYWINAVAEGNVTISTDDTTYEVEVIGCQHNNMEVGTNAKAATCTESGNTGDIVCPDCNAVVSEGTVIKALGHNYGAWTVVTEATCIAAGTKERVCVNANCSDSETGTIPATGEHTYNNGVCEDCGETENSGSEDDELVAAVVAIDSANVVAPAAETSTTYGDGGGIPALTDDDTTTIYHTKYSMGDDTPIYEGSADSEGARVLTGNNEFILPLTEATTVTEFRYETKTGSGAILKCEIYTSSDGITYGETPAASGTWENTEGWKTATFANPVSNVRYVKVVVKESYSREADKAFIAARGMTVYGYVTEEDGTHTTHTYGEWRTTQAATCITAGTKERACTYEWCNTKETESIPATGNHTYGSWTTKTAATCITEGSKERVCSTEGCDAKETDTIAATGNHSYSSSYTVDVPATCGEAGSESKHCTTEGCTAKTGVREIEATGDHTWDGDTCEDCGATKSDSGSGDSSEDGSGDGSKDDTEDGSGDGSKDDTEDGSGDGSKDDSETGCDESHSYGEWEVVKEATCTEKGSKERTCECGEKETEEIPALGHKMNTGIVTKQPTAAATGIKTYTCTVCKATKTETIAALGGPAAGTSLTTSDGSTYKIVDSSATEGTVTFVSAKKNSKSITVPATITVDGITYNVVSIEKNAFKNQKKATKITIGANVTSIGSNAFKGCTKVKTLTIQTSSLTTVAKNVFKPIPKKAKVKVPKANLKAYKTLFQKTGKLNKKVKVTK